MLKHNDTQMLSVKELAWRLNRHPNYVYRMKKAGFPMPGYRSTLEDALKWLEENPGWSRSLDRAKMRAVKKLPRRSSQNP